MRITENNYKEPKGLSQLQRSFFSLLGQEKPKPIPPKLVLIYKYPLAAVISQLLYWHGKGMRKDGYIFKTEKDLIKELGLTSSQQKHLIWRGKAFGFLHVVRKGVPAKRHYSLNYTKLVEVTIQEAERQNIVLTKSAFKFGGNNPQENEANDRTITNITTNNTALKHRAESAGDILRRRREKG